MSWCGCGLGSSCLGPSVLPLPEACEASGACALTEVQHTACVDDYGSAQMQPMVVSFPLFY